MPRPASSRRRPLRLEDLEARTNPVVISWTQGGPLTFDASTDATGVQVGVTVLEYHPNPANWVIWQFTGDPLDPFDDYEATVGQTSKIVMLGSPHGDFLTVADDILLTAEISGFGGDDAVSGGGGNDSLNGGAGNDTLSESTGSTLTVTPTQQTGATGTDALAGFEDLVLDGVPGFTSIDASAWDVNVADPAGGTRKGRLWAFGEGTGGTIRGGPGHDTIQGSGTFFGGAGNDTLSGGPGADELHGGDGDDLLAGHNGNDTLVGGANQNRLLGGIGDDELDNRAGTPNGPNDHIGELFGGEGNDRLLAGDAGDHLLDGGVGDDTLVGSAFTSGPEGLGDEVRPGPGDDDVRGNGGNDRFITDLLDTGFTLLPAPAPATDWVLTGEGTDTLRDPIWEVHLRATGPGDHTSTVRGYPGTVRLFERGSGVGRLIVEVPGNAVAITHSTDLSEEVKTVQFTESPAVEAAVHGTAWGLGLEELVIRAADGAGTPAVPLTFHLGPAWFGPGLGLLGGAGGYERIIGTLPNVTLSDTAMTWGPKPGSVASQATVGGIDLAVITGAAKADRMDASAFTGDVRLTGLGGNDALFGGSGNDTLDGGAGRDRLEGGPGADRLLGGPGADSLLAGDGNDLLVGEAGADQLDGMAGDDTLTGGAGSEFLFAGTGNDLLIEGPEAGRTRGIAFTLSPTALTGLGSDRLDGFERIELTATDGFADTFTLKNWPAAAVATVAIDGRSGSDAVVYSGDDAVVTLADGELRGAGGLVVTLTGVERGSLTGTNKIGTTLTVDDTGPATLPDGLALAGARGSNVMVQYLGGSAGGDIALNGSLLTVGGRTAPIGVKGVAKLVLTGGAGADELTVTDNTDFTLRGAAAPYTLTRPRRPAVEFSGVEALTLTGGAGVNRFDIGARGLPDIALDGAGGTRDAVTIPDPVATATLTDVSLAFEQGLDSFNYTLAGIELANLTGGPNAAFDVGGWTRAGTLTGDGTANLVAHRDTDITLTAAGLTTTAGTKLFLTGFDHADLRGGPGPNKFVLQDWAHPAVLDGAGGTGDHVTVLGQSDMTLQDGSLTLAASGSTYTLTVLTDVSIGATGPARTHTLQNWTGRATVLGRAMDRLVVSADGGFVYDKPTATVSMSAGGLFVLKGIGNVDLTDTGTNGNVLDMRGFTGKVVLHGGSGNDTLYGGSNADRLFGDDGDDKLNGGPGADQLTSGTGADVFSATDTPTERLDFETGVDSVGTV